MHTVAGGSRKFDKTPCFSHLDCSAVQEIAGKTHGEETIYLWERIIYLWERNQTTTLYIVSIRTGAKRGCGGLPWVRLASVCAGLCSSSGGLRLEACRVAIRMPSGKGIKGDRVTEIYRKCYD